jgi:hypothetical protein
MGKRMGAAVAVVLLAVAGCSGGGGSAGSAKSDASEQISPEAQECFTEVVKTLTLVYGKVKGEHSGSAEEKEFAEFGVNAQGTPTWDIYNTYMELGVRDLAQGRQPTVVDAVSAYSPSVKTDCVRANE